MLAARFPPTPARKQQQAAKSGGGGGGKYAQLNAQIMRWLALLFVICAVILLMVHREGVLMRTTTTSATVPPPPAVVHHQEQDGEAAVAEGSFPGLVLSTDRLTLGPEDQSYWFSLTTSPTRNVTVRIEDASNCTTSPTRWLSVVFTPRNWNAPKRVRVKFRASAAECPLGLIHACTSQDLVYHGLHVRLWVDVPQDSARFASAARSPTTAEAVKEKKAGWNATEREEEARGGGVSTTITNSNVTTITTNDDPELDLAPLAQRTTRLPFDFMAAFAFHCRNLTTTTTTQDNDEQEDDDGVRFPVLNATTTFAAAPSSYHRRRRLAMQCVLGRGTLQETPFYVLDPVAATTIEDKNGSSFPVVFIMGGAHGNEAAGSAAAVHIARRFTPLRGRLVVLPFANVRSLRAGQRLIPDMLARPGSDLNRNFRLDRKGGVGELANMLWTLFARIQPDLFLDLHEGWGFHARTKNHVHSSKGSSVIATEDTLRLAAVAVNRVNKHTPLVPFELLTPPIAGGLAVKLNHEFGTRAMLFETTKSRQRLDVRVAQHVEMARAVLQAVRVLDKEAEEDGDEVECVLFVRYQQEFEDAACLKERFGVMDFTSA